MIIMMRIHLRGSHGLKGRKDEVKRPVAVGPLTRSWAPEGPLDL